MDQLRGRLDGARVVDGVATTPREVGMSLRAIVDPMGNDAAPSIRSNHKRVRRRLVAYTFLRCSASQIALRLRPCECTATIRC